MRRVLGEMVGPVVENEFSGNLDVFTGLADTRMDEQRHRASAI
jgi:hypothetical protein